MTLVSDKEPTAVGFRYAVRLFISGDAPNSRLARENLARLEQACPSCAFDIEIIDVNLRPEAALESGVFITPALCVTAPPPGGIIYGNLSDAEALRHLFPCR